MGISEDPLTIEFDKLIDLIRGLGLDPVDPADVRSITIDPHGVQVVRYRRTETGRRPLGFGEQPITETVTIGITR